LIFRFSYVTVTVPVPSQYRPVTYRFSLVTVPLPYRYHTVPSRYRDHDRDHDRDRYHDRDHDRDRDDGLETLTSPSVFTRPSPFRLTLVLSFAII
jgi:hypothetical protein